MAFILLLDTCKISDYAQIGACLLLTAAWLRTVVCCAWTAPPGGGKNSVISQRAEEM